MVDSRAAMRLCLAVYEDDPALKEDARRIWTSFGEADMHPRGRTRPFLLVDTMERVGDYAGIMLKNNSVQLLLATPLLRKSPELEQRLTLLHECIHMDFALGDHNERWLRIQERARNSHTAIRAVPTTTTEEADRQGYLERRNGMALTLLRLPDEIVAEQSLKHKFEPWFEERARYYGRMRQKHEAMLAAPKTDVPLRPFKAFYESLRNAFYVPLVADVRALEAERAELGRLEQNADARLREHGPAGLVEFLHGLKERLLNVSFEKPLTDAEAAYEDLHNRVLTAEGA